MPTLHPRAPDDRDFQHDALVPRPRWSVLLLVGVTGIAAACITPERAAQLIAGHPDSVFAASYSPHIHEARVTAYSMPENVVHCENGMADVFPCSNVDLLGHIPVRELGGGTANDSWGWVDPTSGREYAVIGRSTGVTFVDVTVATEPRVVGTMARNAEPTVWADVKVYRDHALIVADQADGVGLQMFDLNRLRAASQQTEPAQFQPDRVYRQFEQAHNLIVNEEAGFAYAVGGETCNGGVHVVDLNDPRNPRMAGCYRDAGFIHDMQCLIYRGPDSAHAGKEICLANHAVFVSVIDFSDKSNPRLIGRASYSQSVFSHQGWLTPDQRHFVLGDENDESARNQRTRTVVMDVSDLDQPTQAGEYFAPTDSIDHNQYVIGSTLYQANYTAGLRILRIDDATSASMTEIGYFDTFPDNDGASFQGAWNVYPFLPSGNILISDFNRGLFILRPTASAAGPPDDFDFDVLDGQWVASDPEFAEAAQGLTFDFLTNFDLLFVAWFTYTTMPEAPPEGPASDVGAIDNRWMTAQLEVDGTSASGPLLVSTGGEFDQPGTGFQRTEPVGSMTIEVIACDRAVVSYVIDTPARSRTFEIIPLEKSVDPEGFRCRETSASPTAPGFGVI